jgi:hypothetical protein
MIEQLIKKENLFDCESINDYELLLSFDSVEKALLFDEIIQENLVLKGFDDNYNVNSFGEMCENIIDKLYEMVK